MKKLLSLLLCCVGVYNTIWATTSFSVDLNTINPAFTKVLTNKALNVSACTSKISNPAFSIVNPFKNEVCDSIEISFDVMNYATPKVLGALLSFYDNNLGRMYFTNGSYLGYNATGGWFDANMKNFALDNDFLGTNTWKNVRIKFSRNGYSVLVDNQLAFNQNSTNVTINGNLTNYDTLMYFFTNAAIVAFGTGSWWSDNHDANGNYYDIQYSYMQNIKFIKNAEIIKTIDILELDNSLTIKLEEDQLVLDVSKLSSKRDAPLLAISNPFKGKVLDTATIEFDVYNYNTLKVLGTLFSIYTPGSNHRLYFSNGGYLGYNAIGGWFDANLKNYALDIDFLELNRWNKVKILFTESGYAFYVNNQLAYDNNSTNITKAGTLNDFTNVLNFLSSADTLAFGTGSWWSDNQDPEGNYYDIQYSYMKDISFNWCIKEIIIINNIPLVNESDKLEIAKVEYYTINGIKIQGSYNQFKPGIYIKRIYFKNGKIESQKIIKQSNY